MLVDNPTKFPVTIRPCNNYELKQRAAETRPSLVITTRVPAISRLAPKQFLTSSSDACADADTQYIAFEWGCGTWGALGQDQDVPCLAKAIQRARAYRGSQRTSQHDDRGQQLLGEGRRRLPGCLHSLCWQDVPRHEGRQGENAAHVRHETMRLRLTLCRHLTESGLS
jgi:hypothetical protein